MESKDPRCLYIGQTAATLFGAPALASQIAAAPEVSKFLNEVSQKVLQIMSDGSQFRIFQNTVANPTDDVLECHFIKVVKEEITPQKIQHQIMMSSIRGNSVQSLYYYINTIYAPILFGEVDDATSKQNTQLRDLLFSLKAGLQRTIRKGGSNLLQAEYNEEDVKGILSPTDEIEIWLENERENYGSQQNENLRKKAESINQHFAKISKGFYDMDQMELGAITGFTDQIQDALDQIWQDNKISPVYSQTRMENLFKVIGKQIGARIETEFIKNDVWQSSFSDVRVKLNECMRICKSWKDRVTELTRDFWRSAQGHQWKGKPFVDPYLENMTLRISEIFELRSQHDELLRLLTPEEQKRLNVDQTFNSFKKVNSFYTNEYQAQAWNKAKAEYEKILDPMEKEICAKLRKEIFTEKLTPSQLLREFQRWKGLLSKDSIKRELQNERESLLVQLVQEIKKIKEDFEVRTGQSLESIPGIEKPPQTNNTSDVVSSVVWSRQLSQKIQSNLKVAQSLFQDLNSLQKYENDCKEICSQIKDFQDSLFDKWQSGIQKSLQNQNEKHKYQMTGQLMEFDYESGGLLKVNYSEKLVTLVKDARMLGEMGFKIHKDILNVTENAKKFYKEGVTLKQVANFYNSMGTQMIECQKPMMLDKAQAFETIIKNPKGKKGDDGKTVTWNDPVEIETYIRQVQVKATELITENRRLRQVHINIIDMIIELMNVDLLKNKNLWKENLNKIRKIIESVTKSRQPELCKLWLTHLNYQLFKGLEHQYQMGLESLNESLPEIQCDLVIRNQNLEFRPTYQELKQRYYKEISSFITTPLRFQGFGGGKNDIFKALPERNAKHLNTVYAKAEELFQKLFDVQNQYISWTALGTIDIMAYIESNFKSVEDWENNFTMLKQKRRELRKLPDQVKVDCINVNFIPFKGGVEDIFKRLSEALVETLQYSIEKDSEIVFKFIKTGLEKLNSNPQSVEEIEKMHNDAIQIQVERDDIVKIFEACEKKNLMIKQIAGQGMRMGEIESMWREFDVRLSAFNDKIEDQKTRLRNEIDARAKVLNSDLEKMYDKWQEKKPKDRNQLTREEALETSEMMKQLRTQWVSLQDRIVKINRDCEHFKKDKPQFTYYDKLKEELVDQEQSWGLFDEFNKNLEEFGKEEWLTFRKKGYFAFQDFFHQWADKLKQKTKDVVVRFLLAEIENYKQAWPLIKLCTGESFEREHWRRLISMLDMPKEVTFDNMKFIHLTDSVPVMIKKAKELRELCEKAQGEVSIREAIREIKDWCDSAQFILYDYDNNGRRTPLIKEWKEIMTQISDKQSLQMSLKDSRFITAFADQLEQFDKKLGGIDDYLSKLNIIQRKWVYLEPIFMRGALPSEQGRFRRVDEEYRSIMLGIGSNPLVVSLCEIPGLKDTLETILTQLEMCQKALNDFLEQKRSIFSRFYFIGDDDLLEILGQAKNPVVIQSHLKKLFAGIYKVEFDKTNSQILSMISSANEFVKLKNPVRITDDVEIWLGELEKSMRDTLNSILGVTIKAPNIDIMNTPSQICQLSEMIAFSQNCAAAIKQGKLPNYKQDLQKQLEKYTSFDNKGDLLLFSKVKALILDIIHSVDVVDQLLKDNIMSTQNTNDWMWFKQLKYFMDVKENTSKVGMCDAFFDYTYEYQGNAAKLVHTPLTDKCYLTLVLGMKMGYGGNPYGPAGTGKTESVKALGQAFGRQVLVFNCDEGLDYKAMGRIFIGLVKCGAWGCFDEFNRLLEEQLSAISQQIQVIQWAIKEAQPSLELLGRRIDVNKNAGIFVTMNPAGKHYGGRSKLPDNLKQLFRPVAMSVPDNELIAETLLFSEGFKQAKKLSNKIVSLFKLCRQLLSDQQHYDWGLRALKTILNTGGQLIQNALKKDKNISYESEALLLIKAIRINTMSKLTYADAKKYEALQKDMFPGINSEDIAYEELTEAIKVALQELKLELIDSQVQKILQFYEATRQRMGVVIVGPSGCGKTTIWKVLKLAYEKMSQNLVTHIMNPKSMPRNQLLGQMNHDTREFQDGVLTASARAVVKEPPETICWIICDGDIDPEWVESLNSVLDDNHLLTLPNGERINFGNNINFIFETNDLRFASPATVSRLGMIFLSDEDVDVNRITKTWLKKQDEKFQAKIEGWMEDIFFKALDFVLQKQELFIVETTKIGVVKNALSYMTNIQHKGQFTEAVIKGLGGNFHFQLRQQFAQEVFNLSGERPADPRNLLLNYFDEKTASWMTFLEQKTEVRIDELKNPENPPIVYTINIQRDIATIKPWLDQGDSFILVGPEGCGKNLVISNLIKNMKSTQLAVIHCNSQTSAFHVIQKLNQMCAQSTNSQGRVYRPKDSQRLIIYLKDINLPKPDKYDTIQLISFLQQIVCYKGFYDDNLEFVQLERVQIVASMNPSTTIGRHKISTRFTANVRIAYMEYPDSEELLPVYSEFMRSILSHPSFGGGQMVKSCKKLSQFMIELFTNVKTNFSVDEHRHYLFTPRDITQLIFSILRYDVREAQGLIEVMIYESSRIFKDRLIDKQSKLKFDQMLYSQLRTHLNYSEKLVDTYFISKVGSSGERLIPNLPSLGRITKPDFVQLIEQGLRAYEREFKEMNVHLFDDLLEYIAYTERVLSKPGGCILMAGRAGVGRKTTTQLIAHMLNMNFKTPFLNRDYGMKEFKRDLKSAIESAGLLAEKTCLFIEDHQIVKSEFLEYLNSLISAGEVPGLYNPEELEPILNQLQDEMRNQYECKTLFEFFVSRVQKNLSIVISMDHSHPKFLQYCSSNPALYAKCTILWSEGWNKESMIHIAKNELNEVLNQVSKGKEEILSAAVSINQSCLHLGASPLKFLNFIQNYRIIFNQIIKTSGGQSKHLKAGLQKLQEAAKLVDELSKKAHNSKILLKQKQEEATAALGQITKSMEQKAERKQEVEGLQRKCTEDEEIIHQRKMLVEVELQDIQPEVDKAKEAVGKLSSKDIGEIRSYMMPPDAVADVLQGVLRLMGQDDTSWQSMKKFLGQAGVANRIMTYDARQVSKEIRNKVNKLIAEKPMSFEMSVITGVSRACAPLAAWVKANVKFSEVLLKIEPLSNELNGLQAKLQKSQHRVMECQKQLDELDSSVQQLNENFSSKTQEAESLKFDLKRAEETLFAAQNLLGQLSGENERWHKQIQTLDSELALVPMKSLLASAYITYLGGANEIMRDKTLKEWLSLTRINEFNFRTFLSTESQLLTWKKEGLPADTLSMENAIMILNSNRTPLIIDPAATATEWLKLALKQSSEGLEVLNHQDPKFNTQLELSIRFGKVIIILEADGIESMLFPLLRKDLMQSGPRQIVQIGEKQVDYNPNFKLFMCTRDSFVEIPPNAQALITVVNFTVTKSGLEGQLLSITINFEQPELESRKTQLLEEEERLKIQLAGYEKQLLDELANSEGNILENKALIDSLNQTKKQSTSIEKALAESHNLQQSLDQQRNVYKNFAYIGSNLFMVIGDLIKINNMYQFSLASFIKLFKRALETKPQASNTEEKLNYLSNSLIKLCFSEIGRSLFKADRLTYSLHFVKGVYPNLFAKNEWEFFSGTVVASADSHMQLPRWATKDRKEVFSMFTNTFSHIIANLQLENEQIWTQFMKSVQPEKDFPPQITQKLSPFQRCIIIQVFRPDRLESAMHNFVKEAFGNQNIQPTPFSLSHVAEFESSPTEPVLFIISAGSDPSAELQEFAEQSIGRNAYHELAMGGGQNEIAISTMKAAAQKGEWVCFKNLHLVTPWLQILEKEFKMLTPHPKFRLWLTSEPHHKFPSILLQSSLKITYETPPGVKNNLQRTFQYVAPQQAQQDPLLTQLLFILSWFHALIQERRTYIPQGWTKYYEFSYGDLKAGEQVLINIRKESQQGIQWQKVYGILENAIYGGRIDNDFDLRVLRNYMQQIFKDDTMKGNKKLSDTISIPQSGALKDYIGTINQLTDTDQPQLFGLPANIDRSVQRFNSMLVISQLKSLAAVSAEELRFDKEKWTQLLGPICQLWNTLYRHDDYQSIRISQQQLSSNDPIEAFVYMEMLYVIDILGRVHESVLSINKVLQGTEMLTPDTEKIATSLLTGDISSTWCSIWDGPTNPNVWIRLVTKKSQALRGWIQRIQQQQLLKNPVNLSDLFHPETFLNALRQRSARQLQYAIDELKLVSSFEQGKVNMQTGVQLEGLWLQGCEFDGVKLGDIKDNSGSSTELINLPICNISWIKRDDPEPYQQGTVNVPVYHSLDREKLLCTFNVPNQGEDWKRIIGGVALLLNGSEA